MAAFAITSSTWIPSIRHTIQCSNSESPRPLVYSRRRVLLSTTPLLCCCANASSSNIGPRNSALDKLFATSMATGMDEYEAEIKPIKTKLFNEIADAKTITELGAGTGPNIDYYSKSIETLTAVDVNMYMKPYFMDKISGIKAVEWLEASADNVPLDDESQDAVICTLLLCSVGNVEAVVTEAKRLLKPGGKLLFIEHTIAPMKQPLLRIGQTLFNPLQVFLADGCHLTRDPLPVIQGAGFKSVDAQRFNVDGMSFIAPHVAGIAVK